MSGEVVPAAMEPPSLLNLIANAARDPSVDVSKLDALLRMQREVAADQARLEFNRAMAEVQSEMQPVLRDAENAQTRSRYARLETIDAALRPIYARHGFSLSFNSVPPEKPGYIRVTCAVAHAAGHVEMAVLEAAPDTEGAKGNTNKTPMHGLGSTVSYLRRYLTCMVFNVTLTNEDDDGNAGGGRRSTRKPPARLEHGSTWLRGAFDRLVAARDNWDRLQVLTALSAEAPTEVDLRELTELPLVVEMQRDAPEDARREMDAAIEAAKVRFAPAPERPKDTDPKVAAERDRIVDRFNSTQNLAEHEQAIAEEGDKLAWFKQKRPGLSAEIESAVRASLDRNREQLNEVGIAKIGPE